MNLLERVLTLLRANLNSVVEKADDPEKALRQLHLDMRNQLVQVKTQVATAIAEGHKLRKRSEERKNEAEQWLKKASQAIQQNNDDAARAALTHYDDLSNQLERYKQQQKEQEQLVLTLRTALQKLEAKISEVETTLDILVTRKRNALLQQRAFEALQKSNLGKEQEQASKIQDKIRETESRAQAMANLEGRDLDAQLEQLSKKERIERRLYELKSQQQARPGLSHRSERKETSPLPPGSPESESPRKRQKRSTLNTPAEPQTEKDLDLDYLQAPLDTRQNEY